MDLSALMLAMEKMQFCPSCGAIALGKKAIILGRFCYNDGRKLDFNEGALLQKGGPTELSAQVSGPGARQGSASRGPERAFEASNIDPLQLEKIRKESERNMNKTSYLSYGGIEAAVQVAKYSEAGLGNDLIQGLGGASSKPPGEEVRESKRLSFFRKDEATQQAEQLAKITVEQCHLLLIGSTQVGKTCLIEQYLNGHFLHNYNPTVKDEFVRKVDIEGAPVEVTITDMAGFEEYDANGLLGLDPFDLDEAIRNADGIASLTLGFIFVYSTTSMPSYIKLQEMIERAKKIKCKESGKETIPMVIAGTQYDRVGDRIVSSKNAVETGMKYQCPVIETSAIPSEKASVNNMFKAAVLEVWKEKTTAGTMASQQPEEKAGFVEKLKRLSIRPVAEDPKKDEKKKEKASATQKTTVRKEGGKPKSTEAGRAAIVFAVQGQELTEAADGVKGAYYQLLRQKEGKTVKLTTSALSADCKNPMFPEVPVTAARLLTEKTWNTVLTIRVFQTLATAGDVVLGEGSFDLDTARKAGSVDIVLKKATGQVVGSLQIKLAFRKAMETDNEDETEVDVGRSC